MRKTILFLIISVLQTSVIAQQSEIGTTSIHESRKNSVYIEFGGVGFMSSLNYDRIIPIAKQLAIVPRVGIGIFDFVFPVYEINLIAGGPKHFFETGFGQYLMNLPQPDFMIRAGYRYQGNKGLLLRAAPQLYNAEVDEGISELRFWFALSLGYSF
ncbi:MAG: hypothetical protein ABFS38_04785, partial [Bacteroidota bacterium]